MKNLIFILFPALFLSQYTGKVGINTSEPTKTLDINGHLQVRNIEEIPTAIYLLATDEQGNVFKVKLSSLTQQQSNCPEFLKSESNPYYLKFRSKNALNYPNNSILRTSPLRAFKAKG
ncbi:hypothetical protein [Epilithonimonas sp.]|uniref:hypothetical protein n=1 Tax=Epilithonimonas sp. TaxID=2894511 RepID=UPI0035B15AC5